MRFTMTPTSENQETASSMDCWSPVSSRITQPEWVSTLARRMLGTTPNRLAAS
jgi:hypothetical protein